MIWIYTILIWICLILSYLVEGNLRTAITGIEIGIFIGQIIYVIKEYKNLKSINIRLELTEEKEDENVITSK